MGSNFRDDQKSMAERLIQLRQDETLAIWDTLPGVRDALCGWASAKGKPAGMANKLTLFAEGDKIKLCVNSVGDDRMGFVTLDIHLPLGEAIEAALASGGIDWRAKPKRDTGGFRRGPGGVS